MDHLEILSVAKLQKAATYAAAGKLAHEKFTDQLL